MKEIISQLREATGKKVKLKYGDLNLFFTRNEEKGYWINRRENALYGLTICDDGTVIHGYPHLENLKNEKQIPKGGCVLEEKLNGTNVIVSRYNGSWNIRTRMNPFSEEFPVPTYFNEVLSNIQDETLRNKLLGQRTEMLTRYPEYYVNEGDGTYIGLKIQKVVRELLDVPKITFAYPNHVFYFELIGKINPIIIDSDVKYGLYDFDMDIVLFDIFHKVSNSFLSRNMKEMIARELDLELVPLVCDFSSLENVSEALPRFKKEAEEKLIEGYVLKNGPEIVKVKSEVVLHSAHRLDAILKGYIDLSDMLNYVGKVVSSEWLKKPEKFEELVELIREEALADYPEWIVKNQTFQIQRRIAHQMAILTAEEIMKEHTFADGNELFRYLNLEIPIRFAPLSSYINFKEEKATLDKKKRESMKRRRVDIFNVLAKHISKRHGIIR